jgi:hypothetical protein
MPETDVIDVQPQAVDDSKALALARGAGVDLVTIRREPAEVLADARKAAAALMTVISQKKHRVVFNDEQYIENEDWQFIARFYGLTAKLEADRFVQYGEAQGFEATVSIIDVNGVERSRATSMCLNDEDKWSARTKYAWCYVLKDGRRVQEDPGDPDLLSWEDNPNKPGRKRPVKERVEVGEEKVPLFQLRSMAQTRASSKAFANVLRFVPLLAGLKGTPAEELPDAQRVEQEPKQGAGQANVAAPPAQQQPAQGKAEPAKPAQAKPAANGESRERKDRPITEGQQKRLFAKMRARAEAVEVDPQKFRQIVKGHLSERYGLTGDDVAKQIRETFYDEVIEWIEKWVPSESYED